MKLEPRDFNHVSFSHFN